jgi:hypothetical protein
MRINQSYQKLFPNNCPVIETTGDGVEVGTCTYYLKDGKCLRHGDPLEFVMQENVDSQLKELEDWANRINNAIPPPERLGG